jgi:hypothetical protein
MRAVGVLAVGLAVLLVGLVLLSAASSPEPALTLALFGSAVRTAAYTALAEGLRWGARRAGAWRAVPFEGPDRPVYRPTWLGRWLGLLGAFALDEAADEAYVALFLPGRARSWRADANRLRRCLNGATWADCDAHNLCGNDHLRGLQLAVVGEGHSGVMVVRIFSAVETEALIASVDEEERALVGALLKDGLVDRARVVANLRFWRTLGDGLRGGSDGEDEDQDEDEQGEEDAPDSDEPRTLTVPLDELVTMPSATYLTTLHGAWQLRTATKRAVCRLREIETRPLPEDVISVLRGCIVDLDEATNEELPDAGAEGTADAA